MADPAGPWAGADLPQRLAALTDFLRAHRPLWEPRPFTYTGPPPWAADHPRLAAWVTALPDDAVEALETSAAPPDDAPAALRAWAAEAARLTDVPVAAAAPSATGAAALHRHLARFVPGRKWAQIQAFAATALPAPPSPAGRWVDWCAGKGHLGRTLGAASGHPVTLLELQPAYAAEAEALAARAEVALRYVPTDVRAPDAAAPLNPESTAVALHACGALTDTLLTQAVSRDLGALVVAPCCHERHRPGPCYEPLSRAGRAADLPLTLDHLRLATAETTCAPARERRARRHERAYRLAFDRLVRQASGRDAYTPLGPLPRAELALPFAAFCERVAARLALPLPARFDPDRALAHGDAAQRTARAYGVVRAVFRRPLEAWTVAERACFLYEAARRTRVLVFCDRSVTPRNLALASTAA